MLRQPLLIKSSARNLSWEILSTFGTDEQQTQTKPVFQDKSVIYDIKHNS